MAKKPKSDNGGKQQAAQQPAGPSPQGAPSMNVLAQYVKDFSFENPAAPQAFAGGGKNPSINVNVSVNAKAVSQTEYEVELSVEAKALADAQVLFNIELVYGGLFRLQNIPQAQIQPVILIECPRLMFPFARQIVAEVTRNGGYPPVLLDPIDFTALYQHNLQRQQQPATN